MIRLSYVGKLDVSFPIQKALQGGKFIGRIKYIFLPRNLIIYIKIYLCGLEKNSI